MNSHSKDILGAIILIVFSGLGLAGTGRFFWNVWFNVEKLRKDINKEFHNHSWLPSEFKNWRLKFIKSKTWLWYGRIFSSIVMLFMSSLLLIGLVFLFTSIAKDM